MQAEVYNLKNEAVSTTELSERVFGAPWKPALVAQVVRAIEANARRPWASAKGRGEVAGGGKKPWRQKGTGRARHGSIRSPIWVGGGVAHGPLAERDYTQKVNKKMRQAALFSALSKKWSDHEIKIVDSLELEEPKTKLAAQAIDGVLGVDPKAKHASAMLVPVSGEKHMFRAAANLQRIEVCDPRSLNVRDVLAAKHIVIDVRALEAIDGHYRKIGQSAEEKKAVPAAASASRA